MKTRRFWLAAAALSLTVGAATGAQAQNNKIRIGYWTSGFSVGFGAVLELGKFVEKQGLEPEWVRFAEGYYLIGYALVVMILLAFSPTGLIGLGEKLLARWPRKAAA